MKNQDQQQCVVTFSLRTPKGKSHEVVDVRVDGKKVASLFPYQEGIRIIGNCLPLDPGEAVTITKYYPPAINISFPNRD